MKDYIRDRINDHFIGRVMDYLTNAGLVILGLIERAGSACRDFIVDLAGLSRGVTGKRYIKNIIACFFVVAVLMIILMAKLSTVSEASPADKVQLARVEENAWDIVYEEKDNISAEVMKHKASVDKYVKEYGMEDYTDLIYAVMEQESGGRSLDIMQSSECFFNEEYPRVADGITDPDYSIKCGVQDLRHCLEQAEVSDPTDINHIKLALQGYNYGHNYIEWALKRDGGYTQENADAFAVIMIRATGWSSYGDTKYVEHVLRYYTYSYEENK